MRRMSLFIGTLLLAAACNNSPEAEENKTNNSPAPKPKAATETKATQVRLELEATDQMKFNKDQFTVEAGQEVTLSLKHVGKLDKAAMGHNFVLLKKGTDLTEFATAAAQAKASDYIPNNGEAVIAHTKTIGGWRKYRNYFHGPLKWHLRFHLQFSGALCDDERKICGQLKKTATILKSRE